MSATSEEVVRVLRHGTAPMTARDIYGAGNFDDLTLLQVTLHDMSQKALKKLIKRNKPENGGQFVYEVMSEAEAMVEIPKFSDSKRVETKPAQAVVAEPVRRVPRIGIYDAAIMDLKAKRAKIDAAIEALEELST